MTTHCIDNGITRVGQINVLVYFLCSTFHQHGAAQLRWIKKDALYNTILKKSYFLLHVLLLSSTCHQRVLTRTVYARQTVRRNNYGRELLFNMQIPSGGQIYSIQNQ